MYPVTDMDLLGSEWFSRFGASKEHVETTIKPLVEVALKMTDLNLTIHEIIENVSYFFVTMDSLKRISVWIKRDLKWIEQRGNHHYASSFLSYVLRALTSGCRFTHFLLFQGRFLESYKHEIWGGDMLPSELTQDAFTVAVAAVLHLLASVVQYLRGNINRGGSRTYSSGCLDFRDSFVSLLLFHGAYVWIKFRQPATGKRKAIRTDDRSKVYARASKNGSPTKYEARYNIPTDRLDEDHPVKCDRLSLGLYKSDVEALFVSRVARTYYEGDQGEACCVELQSVQHKFSVPAMSEQEQELVGEEKRQWVISKAKQVGKQKYAEFRKEQVAMATDTRSSDPSPSRPTCQPSVMRVHNADEPLNVLDAPYPPFPCEESVGANLTLEGGVESNGVELPSSDGMFTDEDVEAMCAELGIYLAPQEKSTPDRNMPCSDSAHIDSSPHCEAATEDVEYSQVWSVQNFQQLPDVGGAAVPYADGTGSAPIGVEQSKLVLYQQQQGIPVQSCEAVQPHASELQILEHSQQISDRLEEKEPSESILQPYECLLKDYKRLREEIERLQKEKERSDQEKERMKSIIKQLYVTLGLCQQM